MRTIPYRKSVDVAVQAIDQRTITFIASQEIEDRDGDVILVNGIDTAMFDINPILLSDHDKSSVLGKVTKLWKTKQDGHPTLLGKAELLPLGVSARADQVVAEIQFGARKGISIGFMVVEYTPQGRGNRFDRIALLEISSVTIPSCPTCVVTSKSQQTKGGAWPQNMEGRMKTAADESAWLEMTDDLWRRKSTDDDFSSMCASMLEAYSEMDSEKFRELMARQIALLGPNASISALVHAITQEGVMASRSWTPETFDIDPKELAAMIGKIVAEEAGRQTRVALCQLTGRLD